MRSDAARHAPASSGGFAPSHPHALRAELFSALCTAAGKHLAAAFRRHSLAESVLLGTLTFLGLVCS
jgi:hypothetical protein